jgi:PmbA protein
LKLDGLLGAFESARPGGEAVSEWSVYVGESRGLSLGVKDREVGNAHVPLKLSESCGARYRLVWSDGKVSRGYAERRLLEVDPDRALEHARAAAYDDPDAACVAGPADFPRVELHDPRAETLARGNAEVWISRLDAVRRRVSEHGLRTWSGSFSAGYGRSRIVSSAGLDVSSEGTTTGWHVTFNGEFGDGFSARAPESDEAFGARLDRMVATTELLARPTEASPAGVRPVLLHPHVVESYVLGTLLDNLSGSTVSHGDGHFRGDQFGSGRPVLREDLGFRIDPLQPLKSGSYRYTAEGVPAGACAFIERGRLVRPVLDLKYARRMGLAPTPLPSSTDTMHLEGPPCLPLDEALRRADGGAMVLSVLGVHTQDSASGDFSLSAPQALVIRSGRLTGRMRGTISGNLFDLLNTDDAQFVEVEGEHTPGLLLRCRLDPQ